MLKLLRRLKVLHPATGIMVTLMGAASSNYYVGFTGLGILVLCLTRK